MTLLTLKKFDDKGSNVNVLGPNLSLPTSNPFMILVETWEALEIVDSRPSSNPSYRSISSKYLGPVIESLNRVFGVNPQNQGCCFLAIAMQAHLKSD